MPTLCKLSNSRELNFYTLEENLTRYIKTGANTDRYLEEDTMIVLFGTGGVYGDYYLRLTVNDIDVYYVRLQDNVLFYIAKKGDKYKFVLNHYNNWGCILIPTDKII